MGTPTTLCQGLILCLLLTCQLSSVTQASKVWGEVPLPEDLESEKDVQTSRSLLDDDEDFAADGPSGELPSGEEDGSTPEPETTTNWLESPYPGNIQNPPDPEYIYFRAFVNFTNSLVFSPALQDPTSTQFEEISEAVMDTLESEYNKIPGVQSVSVVHIKKVTRENGVDVFVELDVGTNYDNEELIRRVLYNVVEDGSIASYVTSVRGFQFRRLGKAMPSEEPVTEPVTPIIRPCMANEFRCGDGTCIPLNYKCDNRADCRDMSDEENCGFIAPVYTTPAPITVPAIKEPVTQPLRCRADQATCQSGGCISRDYLCDGEKDCPDGSDEFRCGTPSPCEPNEFMCNNGRCALKLWRCDGDNDCDDNSDELDCPTRAPGDTCASKHFECVSDHKCIPASYQCDEEPDCADRSDEELCNPPIVTNPPEEFIQATRGSTVTFTCLADGVPTPMITWRLNWGSIPASSRINMTSKNGFGTLTIHDVKESDQGVYTCEAINARGLVFGVPDGTLTLVSNPSPGNCPEGHFSVNGRCIPCFCAGVTRNCKSTGRYRDLIRLRFTDEEDFKGVNVTYPSRPNTPPLSSTQLLINPEMEEFQLVDLSRRFLNLDSFWTLPRQFLGNKIDSYGGTLKFKVRYTLARGLSDSVERPDVILSGNGRRLVYRRGQSTPASVVNQKEIRFTEDNWQHSNGRSVTRSELMMTLANLESINIRTIYDNHMVSVALSDIVMETTTTEYVSLGPAREVEECRCPAGYTGLSCEMCSSSFERVPGGLYLGTCAGCNCNGHATDCDPISGNCLSCQHNTEGPQCEKCRPGYFGDPSRGRPDDCKPCPCPYMESSRRFSSTCFLDIDQQPTCDACRPGYTGRRCEKCAPGYQGNPLLPNGRCVPQSSKCDNRGTVSSSSRPCSCKNNVAGASCDECKPGFFHLSEANPEGCLSCFCMGVTKTCASSTWSRDQVRGGVNGQLFSLSNRASSNTVSEGISQRGSSEIAYRFFTSLPDDVYYWVLPESFRGDKVTAYGGELHYTVRFEPFQRSQSIDNVPDVILQGNDILLEYYSQIKLLPRVPQTVNVLFRESAWRRSDGQPCTREHLLMALADVDVFMIRATYADNLAESSISDVKMDIAVPHSTGNEMALEVEECSCPLGYRGPSCQECEEGYTRTRSGLYLGTCEKCDCNGHASGCDPETGRCLVCHELLSFLLYSLLAYKVALIFQAGRNRNFLTDPDMWKHVLYITCCSELTSFFFVCLLKQCLHNTAGQRCERCQSGYYGNPLTGDPQACQPCPCPGTSPSNQFSSTCYMHSDGQPTCDNCPPGYTGRRCERCAQGYTGNPLAGQRCQAENYINGNCYSCDQRGTQGCTGGLCYCKMNVEGPSCSSCKPGAFHLHQDNQEGCLSCFCMGVTQQCSSSTHYRDTVTSAFFPGNFEGFALVNRQRTNRISTGFTVEVSTEGTQLSYSNFDYLGEEPHFWQLPEAYRGDKKSSHFSRRTRAEQVDVRKLDEEVWALLSNHSSRRTGSSPFFPSSKSSSSSRVPTPSSSQWFLHNWTPPSPPSSISSSVRPTRPQAYPPGHAPHLQSKNTVRERAPGGSSKYALVYKGFSLHQDDMLYWQLPEKFTGDKVVSYGGKLKYTISYVAGSTGSLQDDPDVQIIGNDITLVARQPWRQQPGRQTKHFEIVFREEHWRRPDGIPANREHLMMVLADLDDILIRASYSADMRSSSISDVSMEIAVPNYSGLAQALEVEQCNCPPGYQGLSCQDCAPGYTRTGGGLYLGHCELCDCNGHSDSCHPETSVCTSCSHNTQGENCELCAPGFFGDPTVGTPADCQPCACPHTDPEYQFSPTCESLGNAGYRCTACQPGYTGQYCERCAPGYVGNPQNRVKCRPHDAAAALIVKVFPEKFRTSPGSSVTLRCQVSGPLPHHFQWSREDGRPISNSVERRKQGAELHFPSVQPSDAGVYVCTCRDQRSTNRSRAEIFVTGLWVLPFCTYFFFFSVTAVTEHPLISPGGPSKPIEVTVEEPKSQTVRVGSTVSFICTARSKSPAYTLVWTREGNRKLPNRAMDFNGILTIQNVQPADAGVYICTGSNMFDMDEGSAILYVPEVSQTQMFYTAYEMFEGHGLPAEGVQPVAVITPTVLNVQQGQRAELRCTATGIPTPAIEWIGGPRGRMSPRAVVRGGVLTFTAVDPADEGQYSCKALNTYGEHTAQASIFVQRSNPSGFGTLPQVQVNHQNVEVVEGDTLRLYCRASGSPTPKLSWTKADGQIPPQAIPSHGFLQFKSNSLDVLQRRIEELQARTDRTDIGTLLIPDIKISDSGTYMCVGSNSVGSNNAPVRVNVLKAADHSSVAVSIHPSIADFQEGQSLQLNCLAPGNPPPRVTWTKASGSLSTNHQVIGSSLRILSASAEDSGEYICRVQGSPGSSHVHQASVSVSVTSPSSRPQSPVIAIEPSSIAVEEGKSASFRCKVHGGAKPITLEWKRDNNEPLPVNAEIGRDGSMTITNARRENHGAYRCIATNPYGITQLIVSLVVKVSPAVTVTPVGPVKVKVGEPITLECQAAGEPRPSVSWHKLDNNRKTTLTSPVPMESNALLQILVARPEDTGTYVCTAQSSNGLSETSVLVIVQGGPSVPGVPMVVAPDPLMVVVEGQTVTLHCDVHGFPSPTISWSKLRSPLPWRHKQVNGSLELPSVGRQDSGEYICSARNAVGTSKATIMLDVETPPYTTSMQDGVAVRVGEVIRLQCLAHGTPPLTFVWTKVDGQLPPRAQVEGGDLQIDLATAEDAGTYKCVVSNKVGSSEVFVKVAVRSPLAVRVSPQVEVKARGGTVEFTCSAAGGVETKIEWLKEGGALPPNHHIRDGVLRIENLEQSNEGVYICRASSVYGEVQDTARLTIQALPKVMINVRTSVQTVMIGNSVEFECQATGDPEPTIKWSKVDGSLPAHIVVKGGMLKIERVTEADAGQYRCTATNDVGSVQSQVVLNVQSLPQIAALPEKKEVTVGSDAVLPCVASGYPAPNIKWSKMEEELPSKCFQEANVLTVPQVTHEDSGTYICTASNKQGKVEAFTTLEVHERVMPYFAQEPLSYLTLPTIKNAYKAFSIKIDLRPDNVDGLILYAGMILYNGQRRTTGADFISLGLVSGRLEFRFDVGSGMATIRDPNPIKIGEFHTVELHRNITQGYIVVDGGEPITGTSQGKFQGLDLNEELHVGGHPNYTVLAKTAGIKSGFVGCIRQLIIQGEEVIFKDLDRSSTGVTNCPTCKDQPCQNGGRCADSDASLYKCSCPSGFTGSNCQHLSSLHCHLGACGPDATCINRANGLGYDCRCHLGKSGDKCMDGKLVTTPLFDGTESYIAYPPLTNIHDDLRIELEFKPLEKNGLMFFSGGKKMKVEDFVAISMVEGHVEFRYELGTGQAVLHSPEKLSLGIWHKVVAERNKRAGYLKVNQGPVERRTSPGKAQGLNIHTPMYLGGVPNMDILPKPANVSAMFEGCIGEVSINNKKVDLSYSFTESKSISECVDLSPCDRQPCLNGGTCILSAEYEYQCLCKDGFEGERCEVVKYVCQSHRQCLNGGSCENGMCECVSGYTGLNCEENSPFQYAAQFRSDGYVALPKSIFPRSAHDSPETIEVEINTRSADGLILWQGVETVGARNLRKVHASKKQPGEHSKGKDFISLGLQNGHLVFSYQLGSGEAKILSKKSINDGRWHKITAVRTGKDGYIQIDGEDQVHGQSKGKSLMVNTKGSIYLGGAPDMPVMTGGKYSSGLAGCVRNLTLMNARPGQQPAQAVDLQAHAARGVKVHPCSS
ncbi:basement membrane-specific heparan sulfate proteoglycan core protein isoform X6 [Oryzias melastigma]|uniref:basement membrane-specific heparan sulfate proteoglycan core protein isoform X6 n=1 Tax=Oryzias melastigma TaxID=30732 RepID=UPI00168D22ED|nr:basement membrane-specific heparan sulfate proteoglycan core protein isoform X6 [Oryzias melastigma]